MELLKERIIKDGRIKGDNIIKVDSFLNHQIDASLMLEIGKEFKRLFVNEHITKILTIEASGIAIASFVALEFGVPLVFAKKTQSLNLDKNTFKTKVYSFTKQVEYDVQVSTSYLGKDDNILIIDDFLANGHAALGLVDLVKQSGASLKGIGIVIEKGFQMGGRILREQHIRVESLAIIESLESNTIIFKE
jgi:xanthine phosphoribosyltransferase